MALSPTQLGYLRSSLQNYRVSVGLFAAYAPTVTAPTFAAYPGTELTPKPMPMISPRHSLVASGGAITLYATDSYNRGGTYVGNAHVVWALDSGGGSLVDNGDGTATYTAPGGSGTAQISVTVDNANGSKVGYAFVQFPKTTYDTIVAELGSLVGSLQGGGWQALIRVRGDASGFTVGKGILIHVDDTWDGTASTFGGYKYSEGVFFGYISQTQYFEDYNGETWLGIEVSPPMWWLSRIKVGETWWGNTPGSNKLMIPGGFAPVDAIWHFVNEITNFSAYHNCTLFYDLNYIDDFAIDQSDLATIFTDAMARTKCVAFTDRYGSLMCIPDPDVRASEWWGTPDPWYTGSGAMAGTDVMNYEITTYPYQVRKLTLEALDPAKMGLFAISENTAQMAGDILEAPDGRLICNNALALATWAVQTRAQLNRAWDVSVTVPLNHIPDLCNFVDVNFNSPSQSNGVTASGRTWIDNIAYRPDIAAGAWAGQWHLLKRTTDDTDGVSSWGQTGFGVPPYSGSAGPNSGWSATAASASAFCRFFDFVNSGAQHWVAETATYQSALIVTAGTYVNSYGWSSNYVNEAVSVGNDPTKTGVTIAIKYIMTPTTFVSARFWFSGGVTGNIRNEAYIDINGTIVTNPGIDSGSGAWTGGNITAGYIRINIDKYSSVTGVYKNFGGARLYSAQFCGLGADPFPQLRSGML